MQRMEGYGTGWSNDDQVFLPFEAPGDEASFELDAPFACHGPVELVATAAPDFGIVSFSLNGGPNEVVNLYAEAVALKTISLAGSVRDRNELRARVVDRDPQSGGFHAGVDRLTVTCDAGL